MPGRHQAKLLLHAVGDSRPPGPAGVRMGRRGLGSVDRNDRKISLGPLLIEESALRVSATGIGPRYQGSQTGFP